MASSSAKTTASSRGSSRKKTERYTCAGCGKRKLAHQFRKLNVDMGDLSDTCLVCENAKGEIGDTREYARNYQRTPKDKAKTKVQRELVRRELARRRLIPFVKRFEPSYQDGWIHHKIAAELERFYEQVQRGEEPRLMLFIPPRHGKTLLASDYFPSWVLGKDPTMEIIASSYSVGLPTKASRRIKDRIEKDAYTTLFPETKLHKHSQNVELWRTTQEGGFLAAGVGGGITGHGAHIFIIDDPIKDAEEADSETTRESVWDWWSAVASTRVAPGGGVLVIQTRWHDDDLSGRLIQQMNDAFEEELPEDEIEKWRILSFPAIAEDDEWELANGEIREGSPTDEEIHRGARFLRKKGDALHEERWPLRFLKKKRRGMMKRHWAALYQQNPVPDEGIHFTSDMLIPRPRSSWPMSGFKILAAFDLAIGEKSHNDWTVGVIGGIDHRARLHIFDMLRGQWGTFEIVEAILAAHRTWRPLSIGIETGQLEMAIDPVLRQRCQETSTYPVIDRTLRPIVDKQRRASPLQGMMEHHRVLFPDESDAPWVRRMREELLRFPAGRNDDIVDALAWLARMALKTQPPGYTERKRKPKSWKDKLRAQGVSKSPMAA